MTTDSRNAAQIEVDAHLNNVSELNLIMWGLQALQSNLLRDHEVAQQANPGGAAARWAVAELQRIQTLHDKVASMHTREILARLERIA